MATLKEFSNGQTGVQVYVRINHQDTTIKATRLGLGDLYALSEQFQHIYPDVV